MRQVCSLLFLSDLVSVVSKYPLDYSRNPDTDLSMLFFTAERHIQQVGLSSYMKFSKIVQQSIIYLFFEYISLVEKNVLFQNIHFLTAIEST